MGEEFFELPTEQLRQGDIFDPVQFIRTVADEGKLEAASSKTPMRAMLLNQSCDIDKPAYTRFVLVPVIPLSALSSQDQNLVKKNRVIARLFLPAFRDVLPESFVHFSEPMTIDRGVLDAMHRVAALSDRSRRALYVQYTRWVTRWELTEIPCPQCGVLFNPSQTLPITND